jgi:hypothetical protein
VHGQDRQQSEHEHDDQCPEHDLISTDVKRVSCCLAPAAPEVAELR